MEYNKLISVTGMGGLYELVGSKSDGAIVRSLEDKTTKFISSRSHQFSHLESIEVYTVKDNVNLVEVFKAMKNSGEQIPDYKDAKAVKNYFEKVFPEMDFERVYGSDMKKMIRWYGIFMVNDIDFTKGVQEETEATNATTQEVEKAEDTKKVKAAKSAKEETEKTKKTKKAAGKKTEGEVPKAAEEKKKSPAKKAIKKAE